MYLYCKAIVKPNCKTKMALRTNCHLDGLILQGEGLAKYIYIYFPLSNAISVAALLAIELSLVWHLLFWQDRVSERAI